MMIPSSPIYNYIGLCYSQIVGCIVNALIYQSPRGCLHARTNKIQNNVYKRITCILYPTIFKRVGEKTNSKFATFLQ